MDLRATRPVDADAIQVLPDPGAGVASLSEAEKLEAAEFMVATRVQHDVRIRRRHDLEDLRAAARRP